MTHDLLQRGTNYPATGEQEDCKGQDRRASEKDTEDYITIALKLVKCSGAYALGSIASPMVSLVLAPFLTRSLSHADYGVLAVINTLIALVAGITQLGLSSAFCRAYSYDYESQQDRRGILSTVVTLLALTSIPISIIVILLASHISMALFNSLSFAGPVRFAGLVVLLQNLTVPGFTWLRAENRAATFSLLSIFNLLVTLGATLILVGFLHLGINGAIIAPGLGYASVVICILPAILVCKGLHVRFDIARNLLSFGVPLSVNYVSYWILQLSDRYLLSRFRPLAQVANYALAYSLGGVLSIVILSPFALAWPTAMFAIAKREDAAQIFRQVFRWFSLVLLFGAFAFSLACTVMLKLLFPPEYHSAAPVILIIATSLMFYGIIHVFQIGVGVRRKTWLVTISTTISALANVGLNLALIPLYGSMGAAVSTLIAYILLALICYIINQRIYPIPFEIGRFGIGLVIGLAFYLASSFLARTQGIYGECAIYIGVISLYAGCLVLLGKSSSWSRLSTNEQTQGVRIS